MSEPNKDDKPDWYTALPSWSRVLLQMGFAGLIAGLFVLDSRDRSLQLQQFQEDSRLLAREDRALFRDELRLLREEQRLQREDQRLQREEMKTAVNEMRRAVDALGSAHLSFKKEVESLLYPFPKPREKPEKE